MRIKYFWLFLVLAFASQTSAQKQVEMKQAVEFLASQELGGRYPGTAGDTLASDFIVGQLRALKLKPIVKAKKEKGFFHDFTYGKTEKRTTHNIIAVLPGKDKKLKNGEETEVGGKRLAPATKTPEEYKLLRNRLNHFFGTKVALSVNDSGKGKISISFSNEEELERIMSVFDKMKI